MPNHNTCVMSECHRCANTAHSRGHAVFHACQPRAPDLTCLRIETCASCGCVYTLTCRAADRNPRPLAAQRVCMYMQRSLYIRGSAAGPEHAQEQTSLAVYVYVQANVFTPTGVHRGCANFAPATFLSQLWVHVYSYTRGYRHALSLYQALFARMCNYACVAQHRAPCGSPETAPAQSRDTSVRRRDPFSSQRI